MPTREALHAENKQLKQKISLLERQLDRLELALESTDFLIVEPMAVVPADTVMVPIASTKTFETMLAPGAPFVPELFQNYTNKYLSFDHPAAWDVVSLGTMIVVGPMADTDYADTNQAEPVVIIYTVDAEGALDGKDLDEELQVFQASYVEGFYEGEGKDFTNVNIDSVENVTINGRMFDRVVVSSLRDGEPHKQYMIFGATEARLYGISFPAEETMFDDHWETIEQLYQSVVFNDQVNTDRIGINTPFKNEYFAFDYVNNWELENVGDLVMLTAPYQDVADGFQENIIMAHERLADEMIGLETAALLKKMEIVDQLSLDMIEIAEEAQEMIAGVLFTKQLILAKKGQLEFVVIRYAYSDGNDAYFINYTALPEDMEAIEYQFKTVMESLQIPGKGDLKK
jgi:hypothetical protein